MNHSAYWKFAIENIEIYRNIEKLKSDRDQRVRTATARRDNSSLHCSADFLCRLECDLFPQLYYNVNVTRAHVVIKRIRPMSLWKIVSSLSHGALLLCVFSTPAQRRQWPPGRHCMEWNGLWATPKSSVWTSASKMRWDLMVISSVFIPNPAKPSLL